MLLRESIAANSHEGKFLFRLGQYSHDWKVVDEGEGKLRLLGCPGKPGWGIYKVKGDCVTICFW
jgi:hypothetical protein